MTTTANGAIRRTTATRRSRRISNQTDTVLYLLNKRRVFILFVFLSCIVYHVEVVHITIMTDLEPPVAPHLESRKALEHTPKQKNIKKIFVVLCLFTVLQFIANGIYEILSE